MKEQTQQPGVRKWAGDDMIALQAEPLSAIQGFFEEYGNCIIQGCAVVPAAGGKFDIAPGLLGLSGRDAGGDNTFKVVPFSGVGNVTLPLYFTLTYSVVDRVYGDGKVKPIAYDYRAAVSAVKPGAGVEFLELTTAGGRRFVDAVKITEKLDKVGNGKDVTVTFSQAASRVNIASGEKLTTILGKVVRWLADLKALAFKDKVGKGDMDAALQGELDGKLNLSGGTMTAPLYVNYPASDIKARFAKAGSGDAAVIGINNANDLALCFLKVSPSDVNYYNGASEYKMWHAGNFNPATKLSQLDDIKDANNVSENGAGRTAAFTVNLPTLGLGGYLINYTWDTNAGHQMFFSLADHDCFVRRKVSGVWDTWRKIAEISDIPASLPANGGNADTVGGKPATDFVSKTDKAIVFMGEATGNIDTITKPGVYGINTDHRPVVGSPFSYGTLVVMNAESAGNGGNPIVQVFYSATGSVLSRIKWLNSWTALKSVSDGGNAETVDGKHAGDFHLKNDNINIQYSDLLGGRWIEQKILDYKTVGLHFNRSVAAGVWSQLDIYTRGSDGYQKRMDVSESGGIIQGNLTLNTQNSSYVVLKRNNAEVGYMGLGNTAKKDLILQLYGFGNLRIGEDGKNYSNNKEIATVDQIPTDFSQLGDAVQKFVTVGTILRKTIVTAIKTGNGYISRVALGLTNPLSRFSPAILSVGVNDLGTEWVDYIFGQDGRISSPAGTFALTSEIKTLSGGAAPTAGQYVSGITVNDHAITVTKANLPTSNMGSVNNRDWNTILEPGFYYTSPQYFGTNSPGAYQYGLLTVERSNDSVVQTYYDGMYATIHYRVKSTGSSFSIWTEVAKKSDFNTANIVESEDKRFMSDAQEAKLDGGLEVAFAGVVDAEGEKVKWQGQFDSKKNSYGLFTISHNENDANLIVMVNSLGGAVGCAHSFTAHSFKIDSYAGAGGNSETGGSNSRGFQFVAYKL